MDEIDRLLTDIDSIVVDLSQLHRENKTGEQLQLIAFTFALLSLVLFIKTGGLTRLLFNKEELALLNGYDLLAFAYLPHILFGMY